MLKRSSRVLDRYLHSLHYRLVTDEGERKPLDEALQLKDTTKLEQATDDGMSRLHKCLIFHLLRLSTWQWLKLEMR